MSLNIIHDCCYRHLEISAPCSPARTKRKVLRSLEKELERSRLRDRSSHAWDTVCRFQLDGGMPMDPPLFKINFNVKFNEIHKMSLNIIHDCCYRHLEISAILSYMYIIASRVQSPDQLQITHERSISTIAII